MFYQRDQRGVYVLRGMEVIALSGDAHTTEDELYKVCHRENRYLTYSAFREDLHYLLKEKYLYLEGRRLYTTLLWRYEQSAAQNLAHILKNPFPNGIALEWGSRGRWFESSHSDQTMIIRTTLSKWVMCSDLSFLSKVFSKK